MRDRFPRACTAKKVYDYEACPSGPTTQPTDFRTDDGTVILNYIHLLQTARIQPKNIQSYDFEPLHWAKSKRPWNIITTKFSANKTSRLWSPPSPRDILNTEIDREKGENGEAYNNDPDCLGKWCWQTVKFGGFLCARTAQGFTCEDHNLDEWMLGCADWEQRIELRAVPNMGIGSYSKVAWSKGDILGAYLGELIRQKTHNTDYTQQIKMGPDFERSRSAEYAYVDAEASGTWTRFVNHSCLDNTNFVSAKVGTTRVLALTASRNIEPGEQIFVNYQDD